MKSQFINSKKELFDYLQLNVSSSYKQLLDTQKLEYDSHLLKTFLLEHNIPNDGNIEFFITNSFSFSEGGRDILPVVKRTSDDDLFFIHFNGIADIYLDTSHKRIWNLYSLSNSKNLDRIVSRVSSSTYFDKTWLYHEFLLGLRDRDHTITRGFGLNFDYRKFEIDEELSPVLKMQLSGMNTSSKVFNILSDVEELKSSFTLSKIKLKTYNDDSSDSFILEDVHYHGKVTSRGNDLTQHISNILGIKKSYLNKLNNIETKYRIGWRSIDGRLHIEGYPIYFVKKDKQYIDVDSVCEKIFDGKNPFKLYGKPVNIPGGKSVNVYDLHIGEIFDIQVFPDMFVFYLNKEVCGNTILRFYSNLQHSFSNSYSVQNDNEESLL
jgi:hypothetical protein